MSEEVIVIGSGPGGYKAAVKAAEKGFNVKLIEKGEIGGVCTNNGCIPSKALLSIAETVDTIGSSRRKGIDSDLKNINFERAQKIKERAVATSRKGIEKQIEDGGIEVIEGEAKVLGDKKVEVDGDTYECDHLIIATGSEPIVLPFLDVDEKNILTSRGALSLKEIPESMVIIGGGYIGLELAFVYSSLGTSVTVVELLDRMLPAMDKDLGPVAEKMLKRKKVKIYTGSKVTEVNGKPPFDITIEGDTEKVIQAEKVLCAVGRRPTPPDMELDILDDRGAIETDEYMETSMDGVYAIGDVNGKSMLAHSAYKHAEIVIDNITNSDPKKFSDYLVPAGVYTHPEIASVGLDEESAEEKYGDIRTESFPISANGRGYSTGERTGFAKIIAAEEKIVGMHLICPGATDIIMEGTVAMENGMSSEELADVIHPHPTYSEALWEAAKKFKK